MQSDWSREDEYGGWHLGENKYESGECKNCKGASIGYGIVHISEFNDDKPTRPYIMINQSNIIIYPWNEPFCSFSYDPSKLL